MAKDQSKQKEIEPLPPPTADADKTRARQWFKKAAALRDQRNYDYAIESIITGLGFWPEAVEEGHMVLYSIAVQRAQSGGKKPGMLEGMKLSTSGKDAKADMLYSETLMAKDPQNGAYLDALLKNASRAGYPETVKWIAPRVLDSMRRDKKPVMSRFRAFKLALMEIGERAENENRGPIAAEFYELAVQSVEHLIGQNPTDMALRDEQRELSGKLTIVKGKYASGEDFRSSLQDADKQKQIYDSERLKQGDDSLTTMVENARKEYVANPTISGKVLAYVEALLKSEKKVDEDQAIEVLETNYAKTGNYQFQVRADDIRLRQLSRDTRKAVEKARASSDPEDQLAARRTAKVEYEAEVAIFTARVTQYPTDLRAKYKLGQALHRLGRYDDAIPMLQVALNDPRTKSLCSLLLGQAFYQKHLPTEAVEILRDAAESHDPAGDDTWKKLVYWLARSYEAAERLDEAIAAYGKLLRVDYAYADGEARKRAEALKQKKTTG